MKPMCGISQQFGIYLHVPFCATRCGYCDFNTYTAEELSAEPGASRSSWIEGVTAELRHAREVLKDDRREVSTVFFGGGTPTLLSTDDLATALRVIDSEFGLAKDVEITTEANPESVTESSLTELVSAGFTRISIGMQSARPHVLKVLDRVHTPGRAPWAVAAAKRAGFAHVSCDLIYGTPSESLDDWRISLDVALEEQPDHLSAYALIVEPGTRLHNQIRRGKLPMPDDDDQADKYLLADAVLSKAGFEWYEVSNWVTSPSASCAHNRLYWKGHDWWGIGPGAHSHIDGVRWWNAKHPARWAALLADKRSPAAGVENLSPETRRTERIMLETRLCEGLPTDVLDHAGLEGARHALRRGLIQPLAFDQGRVILTQAGRLLADAVIRDLL